MQCRSATESREVSHGRMTGFVIRAFQDGDSISELTRLVRSAYQSLADMGLFFWGTRQTDEMTQERVDEANTTLVACRDDRLIATISLYALKGSHRCEHYRHAWHFGQFAVLP